MKSPRIPVLATASRRLADRPLRGLIANSEARFAGRVGDHPSLPLYVRNGVGIERRRALWRVTGLGMEHSGSRSVPAPDDPSYRRAGSNG
jgi:hypothetical protein